jgi:hypothetical protein
MLSHVRSTSPGEAFYVESEKSLPYPTYKPSMQPSFMSRSLQAAADAKGSHAGDR